jgi:N-methylhydantoinase A
MAGIGVRVGIDVGGTFTDVVFLLADGTALTRKILSSPEDYSLAIRDGLRELLAEGRRGADEVGEVLHGTTVATNAILEGTGAPTGLITTEGFRDVLEIRRMRTNRLYDITWEKPRPLVRRRWRREVRERMDHRGEVLVPLDAAGAQAEGRRLLAEGVRSVAVCFLHAYANDAHERAVEAILREAAPELSVSISSRVLPEIKEYERTSTTVINAYIKPVVGRYLEAFETHLRALGIAAPLSIMQSNGGLMPAATAREAPIHIIESGPAAGVTGAQQVSRRLGVSSLITLDIGGTTAKTSLIEGGELTRAAEYEVGAGMSIGHRLLKGGGHLLRVPAVDIAEVGAGGGSLAWIDRGGSLQVGPRSAGARPGPACYGHGGEEPTLTDANVVLGYLNPCWLAGGTLPLDADRARQAVADRIAAPLGLDVVEAAWAIHRLADATMVRAIRAVSTERGRDPRNFALFAFGGKGPVHALGIAEALGIARAIVPPAPGLFSSLALLFSEVEHHLVQTCLHAAGGDALPRLDAILRELEGRGSAILAAEGYPPSRIRLDRYGDLRYAGQNSELTIPVPPDGLTPSGVGALQEAFAVEHEKTYGYRSPEEPVQIVALRLVARGLAAAPRLPDRLRIAPGATPDTEAGPAARPAYFGPVHGWQPSRLLARADLADGPQDGPFIVEEYDATTVVPPGWRARLDAWGAIVAEHQAGPAEARR